MKSEQNSDTDMYMNMYVTLSDEPAHESRNASISNCKRSTLPAAEEA